MTATAAGVPANSGEPVNARAASVETEIAAMYPVVPRATEAKRMPVVSLACRAVSAVI